MAIDYDKGMRPNLYELMQGGGGGGEYELPPATSTTLGGVIIGDYIEVDEYGVISIPEEYTIGVREDINYIRYLIPQFQLKANTKSITIAAGARANVALDNIGAEGWEIFSFRQITLTGTGREFIAINGISTANNGKTAQVALINTGTSSVTVDVSVNCWTMRRV